MPFTDPPPTQKRKGGINPYIDTYLAGMDDGTREGAICWLRSAASNADIAKKFTDEGYPISADSVKKWRERNA